MKSIMFSLEMEFFKHFNKKCTVIVQKLTFFNKNAQYF